MNQVVVILYKQLEFLPPVMSLILALKELGRNPVFVGVGSEAGEKFLLKNEIEHRYLPFKAELYKNDSLLTKITHRIERAVRFYPCRRMLRETLKSLEVEHGALTLWFAELQSAALLGDSWRLYPCRVVTFYELADFKGRMWLGFTFGDFIKNTVVVEAEENRAMEIQRYFSLKVRPLVVANKPFGHPQKLTAEPASFVAPALQKTAGRPIFLYQGVWTEDRKDVGVVLETLARNRPQYCVWVMPGTKEVQALAERCENVCIIPYVKPPDHLQVTGLATVGIAIYNPSGRTDLERKNALFCAPNKIYEYAGFGIPTLGNAIPGLIQTIGTAKAGICIELNEKEILKAADELITNIENYRKNAIKFFENINVKDQVRTVLERVEKTSKEGVVAQ